MSLTVGTGEMNARQVIEALRTYDRQLFNATRREIRRSAKIIQQDANAALPKSSEEWMRGWKSTAPKKPRKGERGWPAYKGRSAQIRADVGVTTRLDRGRVYRWDLLRIVTKSATVAIIEFAKNGHSAQGEQFVANLAWLGQPGRIIWRSVERHKLDLQRDIMAAVKDVEQYLNGKLQ